MHTKPALRAFLALTALVALPALSLCVATTAFADCSASDTSGCATVPELSQDLLQERAARTFTTTPTENRIDSRLSDDDWTTATKTVPAPVAATTNGTNFTTSLNGWRQSMSAAERARLEQAVKGNKDLKMPAPLVHRTAPVDVWVDTHYQSLDANTDGTLKNGAATTTYAGADYRHHNFLVGGMVQMDNADQRAASADQSVAGNAYMAGPYAAYKLNSNVILDARAAWGQSTDSAHAGDSSTNFDTTRALSQARVSGKWHLDKWQLTPSGAITHVSEQNTTPIPGVDGVSVDQTRVSVRPQISRPIAIPNGDKLEPFAYVQSSISVDDNNVASAAPQNSVGGGLNLTTPGKYNISATADYTETMDNTTPPALSGHIQLNVPLGGK